MRNAYKILIGKPEETSGKLGRIKHDGVDCLISVDHSTVKGKIFVFNMRSIFRISKLKHSICIFLYLFVNQPTKAQS